MTARSKPDKLRRIAHTIRADASLLRLICDTLEVGADTLDAGAFGDEIDDATQLLQRASLNAACAALSLAKAGGQLCEIGDDAAAGAR